MTRVHFFAYVFAQQKRAISDTMRKHKPITVRISTRERETLRLIQRKKKHILGRHVTIAEVISDICEDYLRNEDAAPELDGAASDSMVRHI